MAKPSLTVNSRLIVGGDDWVADLTDDYLGLTVNDTVNYTGDPNEKRYWNEQSIGSYDRSATIGTLYYGTDVKQLQTHKEGIVIVAGDSEWDGGATQWTSIPTEAPVAEILTANVVFMSREPWAAGLVVVPFEFTASVNSVDISAFTNADVVYIALVTKTVSGNRVLTLSDGTDAVTTSFANASVRAVDVSTLTLSLIHI